MQKAFDLCSPADITRECFSLLYIKDVKMSFEHNNFIPLKFNKTRYIKMQGI